MGNRIPVDNQIKVFVKDINNNVKVIQTSLTAKLKDFKNEVNKAFKQQNQLLVFGGKYLDNKKDNQTLKSLKIKDTSTIQVAWRVKGGT